MRIFFLFVLLNITSNVIAAEKEIYFEFTKENAKYWQYISDRTMGGISNGKASLEKEGSIYFARLIGDVSTDNNGGFIQLRSTLAFMNISNQENKLKGVRLNVRGNGETYHIFIRTSETRSYRDFFSTTFIANDKWHVVDLPFKQFKHRFSNMPLDGNDIRTFGIVAYGRDFFSDISVSKIIFY